MQHHDFDTSPYTRSSSCIQGFTLLELLITLAILGVLLGIALPLFSHASARIHATSARGSLTTSLFDAQRNATVFGREVVVCPGHHQCSGGVDWSNGWLVFFDDDGNRMRSPQESILRVVQPLHTAVKLRSTVGRQRIVFQPNGSNAGSNATFTLCDKRGPQTAVSLILPNNGRLRHSPAGASAALACSRGL